MRMHFEIKRPLHGLPEPPCSLWDAHVHVWDAASFGEFEKYASHYGVERFMGIASPEVKRTLEQRGQATGIIFAHYLPIEAFARHDTSRLLSAVEEAQEQGYAMVKMWFGPRFLDFSKSDKPFAISLPAFEPVFTLIESLGLSLDLHVADPDVWYREKYRDANRYRTKRQAIDEFADVLERHPKLRTISVHFGSPPEPENLPLLASLLNAHPNLYVDTASTRWIIRELGREPEQARDFIIAYRKRILFASDLSVGRYDEEEGYHAKRYWAQRLFWETDVRDVPLPFPDEDGEGRPTVINGLNLPLDVLEDFYWHNAHRFFSPT
jgi:predicted TIM-barrel fold metal-dependent hydrolase